ncbi:MAG: hypothetical protein SGI99_00785 [Pseudomonadota bacterium]|nr:hypothetical protein [Pseudomonadota bacterium]
MPLNDFICITEIDTHSRIMSDLFRRKFGGEPPNSGHHLVALYERAPSELYVLSYVHFLPFGDIILVGGVCTDGAVFARMSPEQRDLVTAAGGIYFNILTYGFEHFSDQCEAFFGYCGDARAEVVNLQAGFCKTQHPHLLVNFHKTQLPVMQRALIAKAEAIGPF